MTFAHLAALLPRARVVPASAVIRFDEVSQALGMERHELAGGALLATQGPAAVRSRAAIVGKVFGPGPDDARALSSLCNEVEQGGRPILPADHWGDCLLVAGCSDGGTIRLARSAFGNLPCFWMEEDAYVLVAISATLMEAFADARPSIDWRQVALFLLSPQMRNGSTCLQRMHELEGGAALEVSRATIAVKRQWSPWEFALTATPLETAAEAARVVGAAVDHAVSARCAGHTNPILQLSGGLDSATIAAALAQANCRFSSLNMVTRHRSGDERHYARAVAEWTGSPLTECLREAGRIDWSDPTPRRHVRPSARVFRQPSFRAARALAQQTGADSVINGGGGDDLFCSLTSVVPLLDRLTLEGFSGGTWRTARDIALRADVDMLTVIAKAARRLASGRIAFQWPTITQLLTADAQALAGEATRHPWLDPPRGALPGQAAHVALVLDAIALSENDSLDPAMRTISPLVAQPVVETALRVRSWLWFEGGRNRAVIRRAFAKRLPAAVIGRTGKGSPVGFLAEIVETHRLRIRELLLDGLLVAHGIVDPVAVESVLSDAAIARSDRLGHLLVVTDAERWARLWN